MTDPNEYYIGQTVRITATFKVGGVETDPTTVTLKVKSPSGVTTPYTYSLAELERVSAGVYYKDVALSETGRWSYGWVGTGAVAAAVEQTMICKTPKVL
jgi:hypothetical protein